MVFMFPLQELQKLARERDAKVTLILEPSSVRVSWKEPGRAAEVVTSREYGRYPMSYPEGVLHELLVRLGYRGVPTLGEAIARMTANQKQRVYELVLAVRECRHCADKKSELLAIKYEALTPIEEHFPQLATGRLSPMKEIADGHK